MSDYEKSAGRSKHRFFLITQTFRALRDFFATGDENVMQALDALWSSLPDPLVTKNEMFTAIEKFVQPRTLPEEFTDIIDVLDDCISAGPRTLQHLSRCAIRRRLAENLKLPEGINFLPLPNRLKGELDLNIKF
ncbi:hypothetical protein CDAR_476511 [Caerostris darwini]|uniref:SOCS box domain-containing protein n=1 Tax=Caerostris darwini TaxID=1538125 RepID=A0AAV4Q0M6_9ARAC|nr:hypothetical protein CDAR_476511 [Caerostris darwini]